MKTRRLVICRDSSRLTTPAGGDVYGLIEWDAEPILIVGRSVDAVQREAVRVLAGSGDRADSLAVDEPRFVHEWPLPDPDDPAADIAGWLEALCSETTTAWFTLLDDVVVIAR